jgi:hypothetical protein
MSSWVIVLLEPAKTVLSQIAQFLVNVLLVLIILLIGWLIAKVLKPLITKVLRSAQLDALSDRIELDAIIAKGGIKYSLSELIGVVCYWLILLITFVVAINAVGLSNVAELLNQIILYVPNIIAALFILICGMFVATFLKNVVETSANNAGLSQSQLLSKLVEIIVMVFVIAVALEQLNIGAQIFKLIITIVLASVGLGSAIAFGLGCKDIAAKFMVDFIERVKSKK